MESLGQKDTNLAFYHPYVTEESKDRVASWANTHEQKL